MLTWVLIYAWCSDVELEPSMGFHNLMADQQDRMGDGSVLEGNNTLPSDEAARILPKLLMFEDSDFEVD